MFIEDYILGIAGYSSWTFSTHNLTLGNHDAFIDSLANQISNGNTLTEKQASLVLRILDRHVTVLTKYFPTIKQDIVNPTWKYPFRVLPVGKTITIEHHNGKKVIHLEFPFDQGIVDHLRVWHRGKGSGSGWNPDLRKWVLSVREDNILMVGDNILPKGFTADAEFLELYKQASEIRSNIENHLPMVISDLSGYKFINQHYNIPQLDTTDVVNALYIARKYGITTWDDNIDNLINSNEFNIITRNVMQYTNSKDSYLWLDSTVIPIEKFNELLAFGGTALIIVPGGSEYENIVNWHKVAINSGIPKEQISVMFRLPNSDAKFNTYVKENGLNNPVDMNTRVVFVSTKIPKPLIKEEINFTTVINLGFYNSMHFTMSTVIDKTRNLVYYSIKEPSQIKKWRQLKY